MTRATMLLALLLAAPALAENKIAGTTIRGVVLGTVPFTPGGSCGSQTRIVNITGGVFTAEFRNTLEKGQGFTATVDKYLESVSFNIFSLSPSISQIIVRCDDDTDMSSEFFAEVTSTDFTTGLRRFVFSAAQRQLLSNGATYYCMIGSNSANGGDILTNPGNPYAGGVALDAASWVGTAASGSDRNFEVWVCD